jgi:hypothetical protein
MAAEPEGRKILPGSSISRESGQSLLEFLLMFPMLLGLVMITVRANTAIQMAIVNQKYSRSQTLFLTLNSPVYPPLRFTRRGTFEKGFHIMNVGVSDNLATGEADYKPIASTQMILRRRGAQGGSDEAKAEPEKRSEVRIRNTVSLCTPSFSVGSGSNRVMMVGGPSGELQSASAFAYCNNPNEASGGGVP